jgi:glycine cleavage system H protein
MVPLLVILTIIAFLAVDLVVYRVRARQKQAGLHAVPAIRSADALEWDVRIPEGIFVSPGHTWAALETSGRVRMGMDDFAWQMLGAPESLDLPKLGTVVRAGEPIVTVYRGKSLARLAAPVDGVVQDVNTDLSTKPQAGAKSPYEGGWMVALKPRDLAGNLPALAIAESAMVFLEREVNRFRGFLSDYHPALAMAADGGKPVEGIVAHLDSEAWDRFRRDFLREPI